MINLLFSLLTLCHNIKLDMFTSYCNEKMYSARMCPIKCTTIRWNKYFLILKCFNWRRTDIFLVWNVQKCSSLYWITFIHMPISMWSGFMWIHGTVNWLSQTCFTVDMENIMNVNIEIWKYFVNFKKLIPFQKYEAFFFNHIWHEAFLVKIIQFFPQLYITDQISDVAPMNLILVLWNNFF